MRYLLGCLVLLATAVAVAGDRAVTSGSHLQGRNGHLATFDQLASSHLKSIIWFGGIPGKKADGYQGDTEQGSSDSHREFAESLV